MSLIVNTATKSYKIPEEAIQRIVDCAFDPIRDFESGHTGPKNELEYIKEVEGSYDVIKDFEVGYLGPQVDPIVEMVRKDLLDRSRVGLKKYGTTLARKDLNLLQFLNHAYEECLDQANYLKRAIVELGSPGAQ